MFAAGMLAAAVDAAEPGVVPTDPLPPAEQQARFHLPPGFEIQLVVAEPDIGQPMNLNFDAQGRLWITHSIEYPYPAAGDVEPRSRFPGMGDHPPRDRLTVVEGIGSDGRPTQLTHFASGLNIPIGITPTGDGQQALVYSIPTIDRVEDTDGDGQADLRQPVYGKFGNIDTHGMVNSFTRWIDGWVYGCHGFSNTSEVRDGQGNVTRMQSGNTYRFREDGSRFEQFTWGQVNPFGMTFDPWGNLYDSDCHSMPIYLLLRGAYYPSFGKPHDGLGFGPTMIDHGHGSTGICGPAYYAAEHFPAAYRGSVFICNPVNGQVHHDRLRDVGSTRLVDTQPDFLRCDDGWFRPVDLQVGPDGALYVADFYNSVIGHYEVPLDHPRRDRTHGRVWRVVYTGTDETPATTPPKPLGDLTKYSAAQLIEKLDDPNLRVRTLATNWLVDSTDEANRSARLGALRQTIANASASPFQRVHAMWVLERLDGLRAAEIAQLTASSSALVRTHLQRILAERPVWSGSIRQLAVQATRDPAAIVRRVAADALGRHPHPRHLDPLFRLLAETPDNDTHLIHTAKLALRDQLQAPAVLASLPADALVPQQRQMVATLLVSIPETAAADWIASAVTLAADADTPLPEAQLQHVLRHGSEQARADLIAWLQQRYAADPQKQFDVLMKITQQMPRENLIQLEGLPAWAESLARQLWSRPAKEQVSWTSLSHPHADETGDPWSRQVRPSVDGNETASFWSSLPHGERNMGTLRSSPFPLPPQLSFFLAGHNGLPSQPATSGNVVRLREARSGKVLREARPPRHDVARRIVWDLQDVTPGSAWLELVDGEDGSGYAWLAAGRFSLPALNRDAFDSPQAALRLIAHFHLRGFADELTAMVEDPARGVLPRRQAALSLLDLRSDARLATLLDAAFAREAGFAKAFIEQVLQVVAQPEDAAIQAALEAMMDRGSRADQNRYAYQLSGDAAGGQALLQMITAGRASARVLADPNVRKRLQALQLGALRETLEKIEAAMPAEDQATLALIRRRSEAFAQRAKHADAGARRDQGARLFRKHCQACHQLGGQGELVGPQLDGIGARGLDRLVEDILDPNRNVDPAFRATALLTLDGRVISGLIRQQDDEQIEVVDQTGKVVRLATAEIEERTPLNLSPMPANFGETLAPQDFADLLAFLLAQQPQ